jgi:hypothetical protein
VPKGGFEFHSYRNHRICRDFRIIREFASISFRVNFLYSSHYSMYSLSCSPVIDTKQTPSFFATVLLQQCQTVRLDLDQGIQQLAKSCRHGFQTLAQCGKQKVGTLFQTKNAIQANTESLRHQHLGEFTSLPESTLSLTGCGPTWREQAFRPAPLLRGRQTPAKLVMKRYCPPPFQSMYQGTLCTHYISGRPTVVRVSWVIWQEWAYRLPPSSKIKTLPFCKVAAA